MMAMMTMTMTMKAMTMMVKMTEIKFNFHTVIKAKSMRPYKMFISSTFMLPFSGFRPAILPFRGADNTIVGADNTIVGAVVW